MKSIFKLFVYVSVTAILLTGCYLTSVHPLVSPNNSELVDGLEGVWEGEDAKLYFINDMNNFRIFMGSDDRPYPDDDPAQKGRDVYYVFYETTYEGSRDTTLFVGSTIQLEGNYYLDLFPNKKMEKLVSNHLYPVHTFSKISIDDNKLRMDFFDHEWLRDLILNNRIRLKHEPIGEFSQGILVTASTEELQKFVAKYGNEERAYDESITLNRIQ